MATIRCGHCGETHASVAEARACAQTRPEAAELLLTAPQSGFEDANRQAKEAGSSPAGWSTPVDETAARAGPPPAAARVDLTRAAGPDPLGRNLVVLPGQPAPAPWATAPRVAVRPQAPIPEALEHRWYARTRTVIELDEPAPHASDVAAAGPGPVWQLSPQLLVDADRFELLVWANSVDLRRPDHPTYGWVDAALAAGATAATDGTDADVLLPSGAPAWCDGGPVGALTDVDGVTVVHRIALERGRLDHAGESDASSVAVASAGLAPDQQAAVDHRGGAARVIAPAGSGKTRVLTERARRLVGSWRLPATAVCLVAFNERAAAQMRDRTADLPGLQVRTLNALGLAILDGRPPFAARGRRYEVLDERAVRDTLGQLVTVRRQRNTDPLAPWIDALAEVRLTLRDPAAVEASYDGEVEGLPDVVERYRAVLAARHALDFDEQIAHAIEVLLAEPGTRAAAQRACRLLLVDEFQDLAPAHLLLVRLLAAPELAVFGVGDDDQTIYGFSGATPQWLIDYGTLFPAAGDHPLEVDYRCPPTVVDAARLLLARNTKRVPKEIRAAPGRQAATSDLTVVATGDTVRATADAVTGALVAGADPADVAVLARVNATLVGPQVVLGQQGVPVQPAVDQRWLERTGVRSALAWLRLAIDPSRLGAADLREAARRPARGRSAKLVDWIAEQRSTDALHRLAARLKERDSEKVQQFLDDLTRLQTAAASEDEPVALLRMVRDLGLDDAMGALDGYQHTPKQSGHLDDLDALVELAPYCPAGVPLDQWLRAELGRPGAADGVRLATVHRVKGREWPHVIVHDAGGRQFPHRLAEDVEEERRVFHVALTRCTTTCTIVAPVDDPSPFVAELRGETPVIRRARPERPGPEPTAPASAVADDHPTLVALKAWRSERARGDGVPAYVVFHDATLRQIAERQPVTLAELARVKGLGPTKLDRYGDDILAVVAGLA